MMRRATDEQALDGTRVAIYSVPMAIVTFAPAAVVILFAKGGWRYVLALVCVLGAAWLVRRALRIGFVVGPTRIAIANYWRTAEFEWSEVRAVGMASVMSLPAIAFVLNDGSVHSVQASSYSAALRRDAKGMARTFAPASVEFHFS